VCATIRRALPGSAVEAFLVADLDAVDPVELRRRLARGGLRAGRVLLPGKCPVDVAAAKRSRVAAGIGPTLNSLRRMAEECATSARPIVCTEPNGPEHMATALRRAGITFTIDPVHGPRAAG